MMIDLLLNGFLKRIFRQTGTLRLSRPGLLAGLVIVLGMLTFRPAVAEGKWSTMPSGNEKYAWESALYEAMPEKAKELLKKAGEHNRVSDYAGALVLYQELLAELEKQETHPQLLGGIDHMVGTCLAKLKRHEEAIPHYEKAISYRRVTEDEGDLGMFLSEQGDNLVVVGEKDKALTAYKEAETLCRKTEEWWLLIEIMEKEGEILSGQKQMIQAATLYRKALELRVEHKYPRPIEEPLFRASLAFEMVGDELAQQPEKKAAAGKALRMAIDYASQAGQESAAARQKEKLAILEQ